MPGAETSTSGGIRLDQWARWIAVVAAGWLLLAGTWEIAGPVSAGHFAVTASRGIIADNMLSWGILAPVRQYTSLPPDPSQYYAHHPWGTFWLITGLTKVFGRHEAVVRLMPVLMTSASALLLFGVGRALYGAVSGALAAISYGVLPIVLAFAQFPGFEGPTVFGCLLGSWGYVHMVQNWSWRWMAVSVLGFGWSFQADWIGFVFAAFVLGAVLVGHWALPERWYGPVHTRRLAQWWALTAIAATATLALYWLYFERAGLLDDLVRSAQARTAGGERTLLQMLAARRYWIEVMFTPLALVIGVLAVPVFLGRLVLGRSALEILPLGMLVMASLHYVLFPNGADVHIYWPLPFAPYCALSVAVLARSLGDGADWVLRRRNAPGAARHAPTAAACLFLLISLAMLPDGLTAFDYSRMTGGRLNDDGHLNLQDLDKATALAWFKRRMPSRQLVRLHTSMGSSWAYEWTLRRPTRPIHVVPGRSARHRAQYFVADSRFMLPEDLMALATEHRVTAVGPFWFVDTARAAAAIEAYRFEEREPTCFERCAIQAHDPIRTVREDPLSTWELRYHYAAPPGPIPTQNPRDVEDLRIAHNLAVSQGQTGHAVRLHAKLLSSLDRSPATEYDDGTKLVGVRYVRGVAPKLNVYFAARGPLYYDASYHVRSKIEARKAWSLVGTDDKEKKIGPGFSVPPALWKKGFVYVWTSEIRHRPGRERFCGFWDSHDSGPFPQPVGGPSRTTLLTLPWQGGAG